MGLLESLLEAFVQILFQYGKIRARYVSWEIRDIFNFPSLHTLSLFIHLNTSITRWEFHLFVCTLYTHKRIYVRRNLILIALVHSPFCCKTRFLFVPAIWPKYRKGKLGSRYGSRTHRWSLKWSCLRKALPHISQEYGRSSVCVLSWINKL
jgi:hypothetical protein